MDTRLPWRRATEYRGFVAFFDGEAQPDRRAAIEFFPPADNWRWTVHYDGAMLAGVAATTQECSDAANAAWPRAIADARSVAERAEWERQHWELVRRIEAGEVDPGYFANAAADYENLMWVMDRIKPRPGFGRVTAGIQRLVDAISQELFRRRIGE